jgi:hypothetical protein
LYVMLDIDVYAFSMIVIVLISDAPASKADTTSGSIPVSGKLISTSQRLVQPLEGSRERERERSD